jgi:hypothetical protein
VSIKHPTDAEARLYVQLRDKRSKLEHKVRGIGYILKNSKKNKFVLKNMTVYIDEGTRTHLPRHVVAKQMGEAWVKHNEVTTKFKIIRVIGRPKK